MPVQILGNLPQGTYRVCIVPSQPIAHSVGALYSGELVSCVDAPTGRLQFGPITVWDKARAGQYDAVALRSDADWTILAGDDLGPSPGLQVSAQVSAVQDPSRTLLVLLLLTLGLLHRRDGRFQHRSNPRLKAIRQREPG